MATSSDKPAPKSPPPPSNDPLKPPAGDERPPQPSGKEETRLYQEGPHKREWLTKNEARARGHYWAD